MTEERKIITWGQYVNARDFKQRKDFDKLPDAPKHTDEEYEALEEEMVIDTKSLIELGDTFQHCGREIERLRARIKELEDNAPKKAWTKCGGCILEDQGSANCGECSRAYDDMWEAKR